MTIQELKAKIKKRRKRILPDADRNGRDGINTGNDVFPLPFIDIAQRNNVDKCYGNLATLFKNKSASAKEFNKTYRLGENGMLHVAGEQPRPLMVSIYTPTDYTMFLAKDAGHARKIFLRYDRFLPEAVGMMEQKINNIVMEYHRRMKEEQSKQEAIFQPRGVAGCIWGKVKKEDPNYTILDWDSRGRLVSEQSFDELTRQRACEDSPEKYNTDLFRRIRSVGRCDELISAYQTACININKLGRKIEWARHIWSTIIEHYARRTYFRTTENMIESQEYSGEESTSLMIYQFIDQATGHRRIHMVEQRDEDVYLTDPDGFTRIATEIIQS